MKALRHILLAAAVTITATGVAGAIEPIHYGKYGNPEEPATRPYKAIWWGLKSLFQSAGDHKPTVTTTNTGLVRHGSEVESVPKAPAESTDQTPITGQAPAGSPPEGQNPEASLSVSNPEERPGFWHNVYMGMAGSYPPKPASVVAKQEAFENKNESKTPEVVTLPGEPAGNLTHPAVPPENKGVNVPSVVAAPSVARDKTTQLPTPPTDSPPTVPSVVVAPPAVQTPPQPAATGPSAATSTPANPYSGNMIDKARRYGRIAP